MPVWRNCTIENYYATEDAADDNPCIVVIDGGRISVTYDYDGKPVVYEGPEIGTGHFKLTKQGGHGTASLHCFPAGLVLAGGWIENGEMGMWQIHLAD